MKKYSLSVVGAGSGGMLSVKGAAASERFELKAVADLRAEPLAAVEAQFPGTRTFRSHQEMFARCPTDVVCVSTYAPTHKPITLDALATPITGILVEKPLGDTAHAARELIGAVRTRRLPMVVPHGLLVARHAIEILERVRGGEIGDLLLVEIENNKWDIINAGIHWLNFFVALIGDDPVESVLAACDATTRTYRDGMQVETAAAAYVTTKKGVRGVLNCGDDIRAIRPDKPNAYRIIGAKGMIEFWMWASEYFLVNEKHPSGRHLKVEPSKPGGHRRHLENLAAQMDTGAPDYSVAESSFRALEIVEAAYLSNRHRCRVVFPLESFAPLALTDWNPGAPYSGVGGGRDGRKL